MKGIINALTYLCPDFHRASLGSVSSYRMAHQRPLTVKGIIFNRGDGIL